MLPERRIPERSLWLAGLLVAVIVLAGAIWAPGPVLTGWLAAASGLLALPSGALIFLMMMRLIPGAWGEELRFTAEAGTLLLPLGIVAMVPVLLALGAIYPWAGQHRLNGFQQFWLTPGLFLLRSVAHFALLIWLAFRMRRRGGSRAVAAIGLVLVPVTTSVVAVDWLMSLDPRFAASAFGLRYLTLQTTAAFCCLLLLRLNIGRPVRRPGVLGGLLLTLLLISAYFLFLPFFIVWSSNLAENVEWYARRSDTGWMVVTWAFGLLSGLPIFPLLFAGARRSRLWLNLLSAAVLLDMAFELAWIALPGCGTAAVVAYIASLVAAFCLTMAALAASLRNRIGCRLYSGESS